jgi:hypothetical protein
MGVALTWPVGRAENRDVPAAPLSPVLAYLAAATASGAIAGVTLGGPGAVLQSASDPALSALRILAVATVVLAAALQWSGRLSPLPERRVQVPRRWLLWRSRTLTAAAFGMIIGLGFLTHLKHASAYALGALVLIAPTLATAAAIGAVYGLSRGASLTATWIADRWFARRPRWPGLGPSSAALNHSLAICAMASLLAGQLVLG